MNPEDLEKLELEAVREETERMEKNAEILRRRREAKLKQQGEEMFQEIALPESDDLIEISASAIAPLVKKAIQLAASSDNLPQVLAVLKELSDRVHGKPEVAVKQTVTVRQEISDEELARRLLFNAALVNDQRAKAGLPVLEAEIVEAEIITEDSDDGKA